MPLEFAIILAMVSRRTMLGLLNGIADLLTRVLRRPSMALETAIVWALAFLKIPLRQLNGIVKRQNKGWLLPSSLWVPCITLAMESKRIQVRP